MSKAKSSSVDFDAVCDEIHANVQEDRARLRRCLDGGVVSVEEIVSISEALTKSNSQLVELAKLVVKGNRDVDPKDEIDGVYGEIDPQVSDGRPVVLSVDELDDDNLIVSSGIDHDLTEDDQDDVACAIEMSTEATGSRN